MAFRRPRVCVCEGVSVHLIEQLELSDRRQWPRMAGFDGGGELNNDDDGHGDGDGDGGRWGVMGERHLLGVLPLLSPPDVILASPPFIALGENLSSLERSFHGVTVGS